MARGDHIYVWRKLPVPFTHHGIDCGDGTVVHYTGEVGKKRHAGVKQTSRLVFASGGVIQVREYAVNLSDTDTVMARAFSRLTENAYHLVFNNCEHFATWCKTGVEASEQVKDVSSTAAGSVGTVAAVGGSLATVGGLGAVAGLSGSGLMSGLAAVGGVVGGGAVAGIGLLGALPGVVGVLATRQILKDDQSLPEQERESRAAGRHAAAGGAVAGGVGAIGAVAAGGVAGLSGVGITTGLAAIGGVVGGGMAAGVAVTVAAPAVLAVAVGYGGYRLVRWLKGA